MVILLVQIMAIVYSKKYDYSIGVQLELLPMLFWFSHIFQDKKYLISVHMICTT